MTRTERLVFSCLIAFALVCLGCASAPACKPNPPGVVGCIPADCESCGPSMTGRVYP